MELVISKDGTPIAVDRFGSGPALILVDGAMCSRGFGPMPPLAKELASQFTVYHYDRRGRGDSGNADTYEVQREIDDLAAVLKYAGGTAMVFGISSGAALAAEAARQLPGIRRLALYEAPYVIDSRHRGLRHRTSPERLVGQRFVGMVIHQASSRIGQLVWQITCPSSL